MEDSVSQPCPSRNLNFTTYLPLDLTVEILSRLPGRLLIRFKSVSKLWLSIIRSKDFTDLFLARSKTRLRLLFTFQLFEPQRRFIFSSPEPQNNENIVIARHDMTISGPVYYIKSFPVNGFVCCTRGSSIAVCNPTTRQFLKLPDVASNRTDMYARLGYDPVEDQYKVLCVMMSDAYRGIKPDHYVCTVRSGQEVEWRKIEITQGDTYYKIYGGEICIDGAIYYRVGDARIAKFDVRTEEMELIQVPQEALITEVTTTTLANYKGKLACVVYDGKKEMRLWILENGEKQEWCMSYSLGSKWKYFLGDKCVVSTGQAHSGKLMVHNQWLDTTKSLSIRYYDFDKKRQREVKIQGIPNDDFTGFHRISYRIFCRVWSYPGHVENIMFL